MICLLWLSSVLHVALPQSERLVLSNQIDIDIISLTVYVCAKKSIPSSRNEEICESANSVALSANFKMMELAAYFTKRRKARNCFLRYLQQVFDVYFPLANILSRRD